MPANAGGSQAAVSSNDSGADEHQKKENKDLPFPTLSHFRTVCKINDELLSSFSPFRAALISLLKSAYIELEHSHNNAHSSSTLAWIPGVEVLPASIRVQRWTELEELSAAVMNSLGNPDGDTQLVGVVYTVHKRQIDLGAMYKLVLGQYRDQLRHNLAQLLNDYENDIKPANGISTKYSYISEEGDDDSDVSLEERDLDHVGVGVDAQACALASPPSPSPSPRTPPRVGTPRQEEVKKALDAASPAKRRSPPTPRSVAAASPASSPASTPAALPKAVTSNIDRRDSTCEFTDISFIISDASTTVARSVSDLTEQHEAKVQAIRKEHEEQMAAQRKEFNTHIAALEAQYKLGLKQRDEQHEAEVAALRSEAEATLRANIKLLKDDFNEKLRVADAKHKEERRYAENRAAERDRTVKQLSQQMSDLEGLLTAFVSSGNVGQLQQGVKGYLGRKKASEQQQLEQRAAVIGAANTPPTRSRSDHSLGDVGRDRSGSAPAPRRVGGSFIEGPSGRSTSGLVPHLALPQDGGEPAPAPTASAPTSPRTAHDGSPLTQSDKLVRYSSVFQSDKSKDRSRQGEGYAQPSALTADGGEASNSSALADVPLSP